MNLIVVGLGSMGRRRIRLTRAIRPGWTIVGVDLDDSRRGKTAEEFGIPVCNDVGRAAAEFKADAALVCTSPMAHGAIAMECLKLGLHVFTELNLLFDWYPEAIALAARKNLRLFVSSSFMYRRELQYVANVVKGAKVNYIYHSGQYLPDWHPWESYKNFFVADRRTNACREILAIELPWMVRAFGPIESFHVMSDRNSELEIDFNDNYMITLRHSNGNKGVFCQDVISRKGLRRLEVYSEKLHLFWDGTPQSLRVWDFDLKDERPVRLYGDIEQDPAYNANIIENMYADELEAFFGYVAGTSVPPYTFEDDMRTLALVDGIEGGGDVQEA